jgi:hypothetical protein
MTWQQWFLAAFVVVAAVVLVLAVAQQYQAAHDGDQVDDLVCELQPESC